MDIKRIQKLIDLYWDGQTTINEEKEIYFFFTDNDNLPQDIEKWRGWFICKGIVNEVELDETFDSRMLAYAKESSLNKKRIQLKHIIWSSVASIAILCLVYFSWTTANKPTLVAQQELTIEEQREYEIIKELLCFTAIKMNETETILNENVSKMDVMNTYINIK